MKGIESIIAIILILMIVIALAALAYTWFSGIFASMTGTASTAVTSTTNEMATQFRIESVKYIPALYTEVAIRNIGTQNINASTGSTGQIAFYIDGTSQVAFSGVNTLVSCTSCSGTCTGSTLPGPIACNILPGGVAVYRPTTTAPTCGTSIIKVTIGAGTTDTRTISC
jgi:FlaG/FlaF family flagellin (archaellin)